MIGLIAVVIERYGGLLRLAAFFDIRFEMCLSQIFDIFVTHAGDGV